MSGARAGTPGPVPCARRPYASLVHLDGPCRCFIGGPPPEFAASASRAPSPRFDLIDGGLSGAPGTRWFGSAGPVASERAS